MIDRVLADLVVVLHLAFLAFIPIGGFLAWRWPWIIGPHLTAVIIGLVSITVGFECPLTTLEKSLRRHGGEQVYSNGFVDHYLSGRVYPQGYDRLVQVIFAACVVVAYAGLAARRSRRTRLNVR